MTNLTVNKAYQNVYGFRFFIDQHDFISSIGKKRAFSQHFMTNPDEIAEQLEFVKLFKNYINDKNLFKPLQNITLQIHQLNEIDYTLNRLHSRVTLTDIDLFEIKRFAIISNQILKNTVELPNFSIKLNSTKEIINLLDPKDISTSDFYIFDDYSKELASLRSKYSSETDDDKKTKIYSEIVEIENEVRKVLTEKLLPYHDLLIFNYNNIAFIDFVYAKAKYSVKNNTVCPQISENETTYESVYFPELKSILENQKLNIQPINIKFGNYPILITGANMGGKTVILKTVQFCQYLFQMGFFIPAQKAAISPVNEIISNLNTKQNLHKGLSSFGSELEVIKNIISSIKQGKKVLILMDEPASTTNPIEGTALVNALLDIFEKYKTSGIITTHFSGIKSDCKRLRVVGIDNLDIDDSIKIENLNKYMDFSLIEDDGNFPLDAMRIAKLLNIDEELLILTKKHLEK